MRTQSNLPAARLYRTRCYECRKTFFIGSTRADYQLGLPPRMDDVTYCPHCEARLDERRLKLRVEMA